MRREAHCVEFTVGKGFSRAAINEFAYSYNRTKWECKKILIEIQGAVPVMQARQVDQFLFDTPLGRMNG